MGDEEAVMWRRVLRMIRLGWPPQPPRGGRRRVHAERVERFVQYSTRLRLLAVQQTVVVDREGLKISEYVIWLN
jgi:hypothetical protein